MIGTRCKIVNATVPENVGAVVIVVGDARKKYIKGYGVTQCYFVDRPIKTTNGKYRNWTTEHQLKPIDDLVDRESRLELESINENTPS